MIRWFFLIPLIAFIWSAVATLIFLMAMLVRWVAKEAK